MKTKEVISCGYEGWVGICPVYYPVDQEIIGELAPIPKWGLWWLLDLSFLVQDTALFLRSIYYPAEQGLYTGTMRKLEKPIDITIYVDRPINQDIADEYEQE